ncbi:hypothetical protein GGR58DRAFT_525333 [Xylaria digitata]|nr:hypothetical protein GGR58DRAFT_525333 [Xylaria digitata]
MKSPTEAGQGVPLLQPRDPTIPAVCYDACNNANIEAQSVGMNSELCDADSAFLAYYKWLDYCGATTPVINNPSLVGETVFVTIPYTATVSGLQTVFSLIKTLTSFVSLPDTTVIVIETSEDGHRTLWSFMKTFTHLNDPLISKSQNTLPFITVRETSKATPQVPETGSDAIQRGQAWVAGPVIGGVAGVAILILATWLLFRVRRKRSLRRKANELHGESALKSELEVKVPPQELDGREEERRSVELPNNSS